MDITLYDIEGEHIRIVPMYPNLPKPREHKIHGVNGHIATYTNPVTALEDATKFGFVYREFPEDGSQPHKICPWCAGEGEILNDRDYRPCDICQGERLIVELEDTDEA